MKAVGKQDMYLSRLGHYCVRNLVQRQGPSVPSTQHCSHHGRKHRKASACHFFEFLHWFLFVFLILFAFWTLVLNWCCHLVKDIGLRAREHPILRIL